MLSLLSPSEAQTEVEELKREIVELREKVQEAERKPGKKNTLAPPHLNVNTRT